MWVTRTNLRQTIGRTCLYLTLLFSSKNRDLSKSMWGFWVTRLLREFSAGGVWSSFKHCRLEVGWGWSGTGKTVPCGRDRLWIGEDQWFWWASLVAQTVKNLPTMQETQVQSLGREDSLEKGMATHPSILVWRIPWAEEPGGQQSLGLQRVSISLIRMQSLWPQGKHFAYCVSFLFLWIGFSSTCLYSCTLNKCLAHEGVCGIPSYLNMQKQ